MKLKTLISVLLLVAIAAILCNQPVKTVQAAKKSTKSGDTTNKEKTAETKPAKQKPPTDKKLNPQKKPKAANDPLENSEDEENTPAFYKQYKELLATYVDDQGRVDYRMLRRKRAILATIVREIDEVHPAEKISWSRSEKMAFWINTYNIMTLKLIIDEYPIQPVWYMFTYPDNSIIQIPGAWNKKYFKVMGLEYTLREIKDGLLMARFNDPRVCFALSFASVGSAFLRNEPYYPNKLDKQLDDQVKKYLASPKGLKIDKTKKTVHLSNIFNWNRKDFIAKYGDIKKFRNLKPDMQAYLNFVTTDDLLGDGRYLYISEETAKYLKNGDYQIALEPYKWHLNEQP
ncbi:MAG TPA: DUF547 domain-containing protein [Phycisphaerales bacterium]|nr:DUF547 domain-containing protein [Phycisphaerales bacterium]